MNKKGFTLVELLVVISIIAILSIIGITIFTSAQKAARDGKRKGDLDSIRKAMEVYKLQNGTYSVATTFPCNGGTWWDFSDGVWGIAGSSTTTCAASVGNGLSASFAGPIPNDPFCNPTSCSNSWNNYAISEPGDDGSSFIIYAKLETPPTNPCNNGIHNYCVKSQQ